MSRMKLFSFRLKIANQKQRRHCLLQAVCATAVGAKIKPVVEAIAQLLEV